MHLSVCLSVEMKMIDMLTRSFTLLLLVLSHADSNLVAMVTTLEIFPIGLCCRLFHLVGVVLGDFPAAVVAMANRLGVE